MFFIIWTEEKNGLTPFVDIGHYLR